MKPSKHPDPALLADCLKVAQAAADASEQVIRDYYGGDSLHTELKADDTPVTVADREAERCIRQVIEQAYPDHAFFGEESGTSGDTESEFLWLVDPIDGTKSFVRQYPFFSTQIALSYRGELVLGVSNAPLMQERAWATAQGGAFLNGEAVTVNQNVSQEMSCVSTGNIQSLIADNWAPLGDLLSRFGKTRGYGDFYHYHLLASGKLDLEVESDINILDIAALTVIVREAGGTVTQLDGGRIHQDSRSILAGQTLYHQMALEILNNA